MRRLGKLGELVAAQFQEAQLLGQKRSFAEATGSGSGDGVGDRGWRKYGLTWGYLCLCRSWVSCVQNSVESLMDSVSRLMTAFATCVVLQVSCLLSSLQTANACRERGISPSSPCIDLTRTMFTNSSVTNTGHTTRARQYICSPCNSISSVISTGACRLKELWSGSESATASAKSGAESALVPASAEARFKEVRGVPYVC